MKVGKNNIARTSASPTDYHVLSIRINFFERPLNYFVFQSVDYQLNWISMILLPIIYNNGTFLTFECLTIHFNIILINIKCVNLNRRHY